jgi:5-methylcytosine-specific restriction endonuclease McrA
LAQIIEDRFIYETQEEHDLRIELENRRFHHQKKRSRNQAQNLGIRRELVRRSGNKCEICRFAFSNILVAHHIKPVRWGGSASPFNLALICPNCHALVHNYDHYPDRRTVERSYPHWKRGLKKAGIDDAQADRLLLIASKRARILKDGSVISYKETGPLIPVIVDETGKPCDERYNPDKLEAALRHIEEVFGTGLHETYVGDTTDASPTSNRTEAEIVSS